MPNDQTIRITLDEWITAARMYPCLNLGCRFHQIKTEGDWGCSLKKIKITEDGKCGMMEKKDKE